MTNTTSKIWFISGVSSGLGRSLAEEVAASGDIVFGTLRKTEQMPEFEAISPGRTFALKMDVNHPDEVEAAVRQILEKQGRIDVLVNNAGYGLFGSIEETSMEEARSQMETNFFGALALTKAVLPAMRKQKSGHIIQISSMAGVRSAPGLGIYNASKHALEGFSEALSLEVKPFDIKVTIIEPGPFRTEWAGASATRAVREIEEYAATSGERIGTIFNYSGQQPGDPQKAARAIVTIANAENPPLRLPLGKVAIDGIRGKLDSFSREIDEWEKLGRNTDF
jgi:NAD(P)-dependent dehydrogenase (short-subunit alcohol dehydrogenase family)